MALLSRLKHILSHTSSPHAPYTPPATLNWQKESAWLEEVDAYGKPYKVLDVRNLSFKEIKHIFDEMSDNGIKVSLTYSDKDALLSVQDTDSLDLLSVYQHNTCLIPYDGQFELSNWQGNADRLTLDIPSRFCLFSNSVRSVLSSLDALGIVGYRQEPVEGYKYRQRLVIEGKENVTHFKEVLVKREEALKIKEIERQRQRELSIQQEIKRDQALRQEAIATGSHFGQRHFWEDIQVRGNDGAPKPAMRVAVADEKMGRRFQKDLIELGIPAESIRVSQATRTTQMVQAGDWAVRVTGEAGIRALKDNLFHECRAWDPQEIARARAMSKGGRS